MDILKPKYADVADVSDHEARARELEHLAVVTSLENLMTFPFVARSVESGDLTLHGLWTDIGEGGLDWYDPNAGRFNPV
jgi:carbonic anhydrase